jgi:hypothetical protein
MQSVRHRHPGVNRDGVASRYSNRNKGRKSCEKNFKRQGESEGKLLGDKNGSN